MFIDLCILFLGMLDLPKIKDTVVAQTGLNSSHCCGPDRPKLKPLGWAKPHVCIMTNYVNLN